MWRSARRRSVVSSSSGGFSAEAGGQLSWWEVWRPPELGRDREWERLDGLLDSTHFERLPAPLRVARRQGDPSPALFKALPVGQWSNSRRAAWSGCCASRRSCAASPASLASPPTIPASAAFTARRPRVARGIPWAPMRTGASADAGGARTSATRRIRVGPGFAADPPRGVELGQGLRARARRAVELRRCGRGLRGQGVRVEGLLRLARAAAPLHTPMFRNDFCNSLFEAGMTERGRVWWEGAWEMVAARYPRRGAGMTDLWGAEYGGDGGGVLEVGQGDSRSGAGMTEFWGCRRRRGGLEVVTARYPRRGAGMTDLFGA